MPPTSDFDRYLISVNEPIDKLTVNRSFSRMYEDISKAGGGSGGLTVSKATSSRYGLVKFSSASGYIDTAPQSGDADYANYYGNVMNVGQLRDFVDSMGRSSDFDSYFTSSSKPMESVSAWIDLKMGDVSFTNMPNGNMMAIGSFDIALSNVPVTFRTDAVLSGSVVSPVAVSGFGTTLSEDGDLLLLNDYADEMDEIVGGSSGIRELSSFVGQTVDADYLFPLSATLKHNRCDWTTYSSYRQSYVEVVYSMTVDVSSLSRKFFGHSEFSRYWGGERETLTLTGDVGDAKRSFVFSRRPVIIPQVSFYSNEYRVAPSAKFCTVDRRDRLEDDYFDDVYFGESPLTETDALEYKVSAVNGSAVVKGYDNVYAKNGTVADNLVSVDVSLRFFVGSAADPALVDGMADLNAKARLQLLMIGI